MHKRLSIKVLQEGATENSLCSMVFTWFHDKFGLQLLPRGGEPAGKMFCNLL